MANFQAALTATINSTCGQIAINDTSNYSSASDLLQAWFADYRYVNVMGPSGFIYTYGSLYPGDGSNALIPPAYPVVTNTETWNNTLGDGVYYVQLITVPTYEVAATIYTFVLNQYWYSRATKLLYQCIQVPASPWISQNYTVGQQVIYTDGEYYQCILNTTSSQVPTNATYWEVIPTQGPPNTLYWTPVAQSVVAGSSVYAATAPVVSQCSINTCYANMAQAAICDFGGDGCGVGNLCLNPKLLKANQLKILLDNIKAQIALYNYSQVQKDISAALGICSNCPTPLPNTNCPVC